MTKTITTAAKLENLVAIDVDARDFGQNDDWKAAGAIAETAAENELVAVVSSAPLTAVQAHEPAARGATYAIAENGAMVYDLVENKPVLKLAFEPEEMAQLAQMANQTGALVQAITNGRSLFDETAAQKVMDYRLYAYPEMRDAEALRIADFDQALACEEMSFEQVNLYYENEVERNMALWALTCAGFYTIARCDTAIEVLPHGANEGRALVELYEALGLTRNQVVVLTGKTGSEMLAAVAGVADGAPEVEEPEQQEEQLYAVAC